jgi:hypothetical protein
MELTAGVSFKGTGLFPNRFDFEGCGAATQLVVEAVEKPF